MIQCKDCEFFELRPDGGRLFRCDPFSTIKEPECLAKWQLMRIEMLVGTFHSMSAWQEKLAPVQDKILKYVKRELQDLDETERWKLPDDEDPEDPNPPYPV
jgi:hypothetical protein